MRYIALSLLLLAVAGAVYLAGFEKPEEPIVVVESAPAAAIP